MLSTIFGSLNYIPAVVPPQSPKQAKSLWNVPLAPAPWRFLSSSKRPPRFSQGPRLVPSLPDLSASWRPQPSDPRPARPRRTTSPGVPRARPPGCTGAGRVAAAELCAGESLPPPAVRGVAEVKKPCSLPMLSVDMENKENGSVGVKNSMENGRPPDPADWAVMDVVNYFRTAGFEEQASAFQEQEIDGKSLLLMTRNDVLTGLQLKLGPALKIYEYHVKPLQTKHLKNNSS
ncbi:sterile alpha motif domain-containing protein 13 [Hyaena hyaena]|uniref:sterile alpha motif domain-containing protein 13 n=1 Tax=Hyaena hyaena TaxID=95912 RepID=UPI001920FA9E|nr:sterile alpha motif domain-containing protein 13 [Hyaena hyaena]